jgi:hypothetical protein
MKYDSELTQDTLRFFDPRPEAAKFGFYYHSSTDGKNSLPTANTSMPNMAEHYKRILLYRCGKLITSRHTGYSIYHLLQRSEPIYFSRQLYLGVS